MRRERGDHGGQKSDGKDLPGTENKIAAVCIISGIGILLMAISVLSGEVINHKCNAASQLAFDSYHQPGQPV